ncbi:ATP-binding protein, partial [Limosilactobacillus reuteri]|uniref:ATP-binding protein n=1 Tax=Limosilactobacillus reuteri TaxID=1598 RepID=UPI001CDCA94D
MNQYQKLVDNLTKLNLDNMAASIADYHQQVNDNQISFSEALLELTDKEIAYQQQKSLKRRIKRARFPIIKLLSDFDYQFQPSINCILQNRSTQLCNIIIHSCVMKKAIV